MLRSLVLSLTLLMLASLSTPSFAAQTAADGGPTGCLSQIGASPVPSDQSGPANSAKFGAIPAPIQVLPGVNMPELIDPVRGDETRQTWTDENGLLHIQGTIDYHGSGFRMPARNASSGGHLASLAPTCSQNGSDAPVTYNTVCGGGCITQYQKWSVNLYYNDADPSNLYYQRLEVRVWWVREGSTYINWSGSATSTFREIMLKCDGSLWSRDTYSSWSPSWYTDWRSYDYYWNETWMPIMGGPGDKHMVVFTDTPTNYGVNLYTQQVFN